MSKKTSKTRKTSKTPFSFRVRLGQHEIEICGDRKEVLETIEKLPELMGNVSKAFGTVQLEATAVSVSKSEERGVRGIPLPLPKISKAKNCSEAVLKLLESNWGRWRPRTLNELSEALKANALHYPASTLSGVLNWLV